jgi:elongation factor Ts
MADISAATVMKLRKMSGQGMMDCKAALKESDGDLDDAIKILRKKGLATLAKRAGRDTGEGRVVCKASDDKKTAAISSLCCETDFASKSDDFAVVANLLADYSMVCESCEGAESLAETSVDGKKFTEVITELISKTGEKTEVGDYVKYSVSGTGVLGIYIHFNNKVGAMVEVETSSDEVSCAVEPVAVGVAMHITAMNPVSLDRDSIDPKTIESEKAIAAEQVKNKPPEILEKIIEGKINKFLQENCLVNQKFVKDDSVTVEEAITAAAKSAGGEAKIKRFTRVEIG